ncbi:MAG TPA: sugar ABC transporter permease [Bacilli bacterium]
MLDYKKDGRKALLALAPTLVLMAIFTFWPIISTIITSFMEGYTFNVWYDTRYAYGWIEHFGETIIHQEYNELGEPTGEITKIYFGFGFGNYVKLFKDDIFILALKNTAIMVIISVPLAVIIALLIAVALNGIKKFQGFFQTLYFLPYVTNTIALGLVFSAMFSAKSGLVNSLLISLGMEPVAWVNALGNDIYPTRESALFVITLYTIWSGLAFKILVFLSGMQSIDKQYYQAAQIDATPKWRVFTRITVPLLSPMIAYITITSFIGAFKAYTQVISVFNNRYGPASNPNMLITVVGYIYDALAQKQAMGKLAQASAASLVLFAIIMVITMVQLWINKKKVHY